MGKRKRASAMHESGDGLSHHLKTLFVKNLPFSFTDSQLEQVFGDIGPVRRCFIVKPKGSDRHHGIAFIQFATAEDAKHAIESKNGLVIDGRKITVALAKKRPSLEQRQAKRQKGNTEQVDVSENSKRGISKAKIRIKTETTICDGDALNTQKTGSEVFDGAFAVIPKASGGQRVSRTVVFGGLVDSKMKEKVLLKAKQVGAVECVTDPLSELELQSHGLARDGCKLSAISVVYKSVSIAHQAVVRLHQQEVAGGVVWARQLGGEGSKVKKWRLIIRNMPFQVTDEEVRKIFSKAGFVWSVTLPEGANGCPTRGFAFVSYTNKKDAEMAISSINGIKIRKRTIAVDWAISKKKFQNAMMLTGESHGNQSADNENEDSSSEDEEIDKEDLADGNERPGNASDNLDISKELDVAWKVLNKIVHSSEEGAPTHTHGSTISTDKMESNETKSSNPSSEKITAKKKLVNASASLSQTSGQQQKEDSLQRTVFVSNLPFDINNDELKSRLSVFGKVKAVHCVLHKVTRRPKGTAFVEFKEDKAAEAAMSASGSIMMKGRPVTILRAIDRSIAGKMAEDKTQKKSADHRNLYLTQEGLILEGMPVAVGVSAEDLLKRRQLAQKKAVKLKSPNFHVSKTRLSVYNIPKSMSEKELKKLFIGAVKLRAYKQNPVIKQVKILKDAKTPNSNSKPRGLAFVEFTEHEHALVALRVLNNNPETFGPERRPIVEFAVENIRKVQKHKASRLASNKVSATSDETFGPERRPIVEFAVENIRKVQKHKASRLASNKVSVTSDSMHASSE